MPDALCGKEKCSPPNPCDVDSERAEKIARRLLVET